ncbi:metallophosphoesterase family protein [Virgibacillus salexigens]|uniref:DeoR family transcriptional regulator n=1 Tax=Virgibacillus kapii TaxID=1638645 RepID=A0ABQ2D6C9_9BACI|nr:metallophosphoesterase family protein [Virgibacillus kapii]GGJ44932.1 DeoR family transcriptional regulator [Virgibacillus kapii]
MKIAALYDIHGNLPALSAVLKELEEIKPDSIVVGGDIVSGPMPRRSLERVLSLADTVNFIRGNGDREVVMAFDGIPLPSAMSEKGRENQQWVASQLTRSQRDFLSELPTTITLPVGGLGDVLFCHATPSSDEEIFTPLTSQERITNIFSDVQQKIVVCGHTHMQFERQAGDIRILNAGSVGMPFADEPGAYWLLLSPMGVEFRRTTYDFEMAAKWIKRSGDPQGKEFAKKNVLEVPTAAEAARLLEKA